MKPIFKINRLGAQDKSPTYDTILSKNILDDICYRILNTLEEKGYIRKGSSKNRTIEILVPNEYIEKEEKLSFNKNEFIEKQTDEYVLNWLVPNAQKNTMEPTHIKLFAGKSTDEDFPHEGEEFGFVLKGEIVLVLGKRKVKVKKGESFYFTANKVHKIVNNGKVDAEFIWVSSPPSLTVPSAPAASSWFCCRTLQHLHAQLHILRSKPWRCSS